MSHLDVKCWIGIPFRCQILNCSWLCLNGAYWLGIPFRYQVLNCHWLCLNGDLTVFEWWLDCVWMVTVQCSDGQLWAKCAVHSYRLSGKKKFPWWKVLGKSCGVIQNVCVCVWWTAVPGLCWWCTQHRQRLAGNTGYQLPWRHRKNSPTLWFQGEPFLLDVQVLRKKGW